MKLVKTRQNKPKFSPPTGGANHPTSFGKMDAIACGVQARLEESTCFSRRLTDETVNTARALGVAEPIIERWTAQRLNRLAQESEQLREIRSILYRVRWDSSGTAIG